MRPYAGLSRAARMKKIADSGLVIAFLNRKDKYHRWAVEIFEREAPPFHTAEPILAEVAAVIGTPDDVLRMVELGDLVISLNLQQEVAAVRALAAKYKDRPMDLGDACCVRLAEVHSGSVVYTVDRTDFTVYRKHNRQSVPCVFPS
jgi:predicted nucleic acid-binding protein